MADNHGGGDIELNEVEAKLAQAYEEGDPQRLEQMISELPDTLEPRPLPTHTWYLDNNEAEDTYCYLCTFDGPGDGQFQRNEEREWLEAKTALAGTVDLRELCIAMQNRYNEYIQPITGRDWSIASIRRHILKHKLQPRVVVSEHINDNRTLLEECYRRAYEYNAVTQEQRVSKDALENILKLQKHIEAELKLLQFFTK